MEAYSKYNDDYIEEQFIQALDNDNLITVAGIEFLPSRVLRELDPIAYCTHLNDFEDGFDQVYICSACECEFNDFDDAERCCAFACPVCGTRYDDEDDALECHANADEEDE